MFRIDKTNIDYIFGVVHSRGYKEPNKEKIVRTLYHTNGVANSKVKKLLEETWW